jgi:rhodanese-related sulfurtransferase
VDSLGQISHNQVVTGSGTRRTLDELLAEAECRITRHSPADAYAATRTGGLLVDIRSDSDRERDGIVPGSLHIPRTVLEWRTDPDSPCRNPYVGGLDQQIILLCDHGCSSILAAAALTDLGFTRAGDVVGGFAAWRAADLPARRLPPPQRGPSQPAGMTAPSSYY